MSRSHAVALAMVALSALGTPRAALAQERTHASENIELRALSWLRLTAESDGSVRLSLPLFRPSLRVRTSNGRVSLSVKPELAPGRERLLDAYVDISASREMQLRVGHFKTPFSGLWLRSTSGLPLPDRGAAVDRFNTGRALGVMVTSTALRRWRFRAGVFAAERGERTFAPLAAARTEFTAYDNRSNARPSRLVVGTGSSLRVAGAHTPATVTAGVDLALTEGPLSLLTEGFVSHDVSQSNALSMGAVVQSSVFVFSRSAEFVARANLVHDPAANTAFREIYEAGLVVHFLTGGARRREPVKLIARYRFDATQRTHDGLVQLQLAL